jgi:hypothetical protein
MEMTRNGNNIGKTMITIFTRSNISLVPLLLLFLAAGAGEARASLSFSETFLGGKSDGNYFDVWQGYTARFAFNLTTTGETATLYNASNNQEGSPRLPTHDETSFVPNTNRIDAAGLSFTISSSDLARETVNIRSALYDGNRCLKEQTYTLGSWWTEVSGQRKYADLNIDLLALNLGQYLEDGRFVTLVIAPDTPSPLANDFRIDTASLTVDATPTPVPAAAWLLGSGLVGLVGIRRRLKQTEFQH